MQIRIKDFGPFNSAASINDGYIKLNDVTCFISDSIDIDRLHALTTLVALFLRLESDFSDIYGRQHIKDGNSTNARQVLAPASSSTNLKDCFTPKTKIDWEGERYIIHVNMVGDIITFHGNEGVLASNYLHFPYKSFPENSNIISSVCQAIDNGKLLCAIDYIEQGLSPVQQSNLLFSLLEALNHRQKDRLVFATYSPYILSALTNVIKTDELIRYGFDGVTISHIIPVTSAISNDKVHLYEVGSKGSIVEVPSIDYLPSDSNMLNDVLEKEADTLSRLLDIELSGFIK